MHTKSYTLSCAHYRKKQAKRTKVYESKRQNLQNYLLPKGHERKKQKFKRAEEKNYEKT